MPLYVNTNTLSLNAQTNLSKNTHSLAKSMEKLASGFRINRAGDDAAGLQVSESLRTQFRGQKKAADNTQDAINMLNIADGALQVIEDNLQRIRELAVQAANDTYNAAQRTAIQLEVDARIADITRISDNTQFNGVQLLDGTFGAANFFVQVGPNASAADSINIGGAAGALTNADFPTLSGGGATSVATQAAATTTITTLTTSITNLNTQRGRLGAFVNRLESALDNLSVGIENLQAAEARVRNVDVAEESATMIKFQVLQQSAAAMLMQANQTPTIALSLLKG